MTDSYTRGVLTVIAVALLVLALRPAIPSAWAAEDVRCSVSGPIEVRLTSIDDEVEVKWAFNQPGSSTSSPLHVRPAQ